MDIKINAKSRLSQVTAAPFYPKAKEFVERALRHAEPHLDPKRFGVQSKDIYNEVFEELGDSRFKVVEHVLTTVTDPHILTLMLNGKSVGSRTLDDFALKVGLATGTLDSYVSKPSPLSQW